jgi:plasmid stabilization system protein ParE
MLTVRLTSLTPVMAHKVRITPEAEADLRSIGDYIAAQDAPASARRFVESLRRRIASLKTFPEGYGLAPEAQAVGIELRQTMHGMYRVLYTVAARRGGRLYRVVPYDQNT